MTDHTDDRDLISKGAEEARRLLAHLERSRDTQPQRLADMRASADAERTRALNDEPWMETVGALPTYNAAGELTGLMGLPSLDAKTVWGARLAFDLVSRDLPPKDIISEYFGHITDVDHLMLVFAEACETFAEAIVTPLLDIIERTASDYDTRVRLVDAARNAWSVRCADLEGTMPRPEGGA
ncbi:hypothetical protein K8O93_01845 [Gordonia bronchialis]|uniref:hypothetical protein n=1 Tax=Gordonia bronchialis TaxID=2054 RepID=UPI001CBB4069|nr:hypothetical protein [Gordonia bronchialis]UAK38562.1 hypothetical protein K8O93_01845 [Gordonia bronchialis]